jgi:GNAT superfamily N-acetyltransferase
MIRQATAADQDRLVEMAIRFIGETRYKDVVVINPAQLEALVGRVLDLGVIFVADVYDGYLVGMLALVALTHPISAEPYADELAWWVEPAYRRGTIGLALLDAGEHWARTHGLAAIKMVAPAGASAVERCYQRRGYEAVETAYQKRLP